MRDPNRPCPIPEDETHAQAHRRPPKGSIGAATPGRASAPPSLADPDPLPADAIAAFADDPDFVTALARGLAVLLALSDKRRRMSIAQVSHRTGIPRAAARRSLHTLAKLGFVAADDARRFYLRPRVLSLSHAYLSASPIAVLAQPILDRLGESLHKACSLATLDGDEIVPHAVDLIANHVPVAQCRPPPARVLHVDRSRDARSPDAGRARHLSRASKIPSVHRAHSQHRGKARRAAGGDAGIGIRVREPDDGAAIVHARRARARRRGSLRRRDNVILQGRLFSRREMAERFYHPLQQAALELGSLLLP